jgi:hypothetical protein
MQDEWDEGSKTEGKGIRREIELIIEVRKD